MTAEVPIEAGARGNPARDPKVTVIIPGRNVAKNIELCLSSIRAQDYPAECLEILYIDDRSGDDSVSIASKFASRIIKMSEKCCGPAAARNEGVKQATAEIIVFFDADTVAPSWTVRRLVEHLTRDKLDGIFGSYDSEPSERNFVSQYRNLLHHFVHQTSRGEASTFWAGCGAVLKSSFQRAGGFDAERYSRPMIEDVELGHRMRALGMRIALDRSITVKHLKKWTLLQMIKADIFYRGIPWVRLLLQEPRSSSEIGDLNLKVPAFLSVGLAWMAVILAVIALWHPLLFAAVFVLMLLGLLINMPVCRFFCKVRGPSFALMSAPLQFVYHLYNGVSVTLAVLCQLKESVLPRQRSLGSVTRR